MRPRISSSRGVMASLVRRASSRTKGSAGWAGISLMLTEGFSGEGEAQPDSERGEEGGDQAAIDFDGMLDDEASFRGQSPHSPRL